MELSRLLVLAALLSGSIASLCKSTESQPNPIRKQYPTTPTGTINGTIAIIPIPLSLALSILPPRFTILEHAYRALLPSFPANQYPAVLQSVLDHDIGTALLSIPDFSRAALSFPFVDVLGDNYTSFRYGAGVLISDNPVAVLGAASYGPPLPLVGAFDPPCEGYRFVDGGPGAEEILLDGYFGPKVPGGVNGKLAVSTRFAPAQEMRYPLGFYKNVTSQVISPDSGTVCDNFVSLFNTSVTEGVYVPVPVVGTVELRKPLFARDQRFTDVHGLKLDLAFVENNYVSCRQYHGYSGP